MDPRRHLVRLHRHGAWPDRTEAVRSVEPRGRTTRVVFTDGAVRDYRPDHVLLRSGGQERPVAPGSGVMVGDDVWTNVTALVDFGDETRIFYATRDGERSCLRTTPSVAVADNAAARPRAEAVMRYWRAIADTWPAGDPTRHAMEALQFIHPDSALAAYLAGQPVANRRDDVLPIFPFSSNISQRTAVTTALTHQFSVIQGPPGTGKTQTILNLIASLVAAGDRTVGVVSFTNAAVENVQDKLTEAGVGFLAAALGNAANQQAFIGRQHRRNADVAAFRNRPAATSRASQDLTRLTARLGRAQEAELKRARLWTELSGYELEREHFRRHVSRRELPPLESTPRLHRSTEKVLRLLAESIVEQRVEARWATFRRLRRHLRFGAAASLDLQDLDVVLAVQAVYYDQRIAELRWQIAAAETELALADLPGLLADHAGRGRALLDEALSARYAAAPPRVYAPRAWLKDARFSRDYPVLLSTCHSLPRNIRPGTLLDVLIIDESSQVNLMTAAVAMAHARQVVIVGDEQQLPHIVGDLPTVIPPDPAYDFGRHNLMSSVRERYVGCGGVPTVTLREHYRCAPAIIGYCNRAYYKNDLVVLTTPHPTLPALEVVATTPGHHMRLHAAGGTSNQREIDVVLQEVLPTLAPALRGRAGIIAPYRLQADKLAAQLHDGSLADTVHTFQGAQRPVIVMSSVIDDSWRGRRSRRFVDDAKLINVAVSRAEHQFILVTHDSLHPGTQHLAQLIDYIRYENLADDVRRSAVVSVFDLLYRDFSAQLTPLAEQLRHRSRFRSENAMWALLDRILAEDRYATATAVWQYPLGLLIDPELPLDDAERRFIRTTSSIDFIVENRVSRAPLFAIEVDGFAFHENNPEQLRRDRLKDGICRKAGLDIQHFPTTGSNEEARIRALLDKHLVDSAGS